MVADLIASDILEVVSCCVEQVQELNWLITNRPHARRVEFELDDGDTSRPPSSREAP